MHYIGLAHWYLILFVSSGDSNKKDPITLVGAISSILVGVFSFPTGLALIIYGSIQRSDSFILGGTGFLIAGLAVIVAIIIVVIWLKHRKRS